MRTLSTFTAVLLSSTVFVSASAFAADASALKTAITNETSSITLTNYGDQTLENKNNVVQYNMTIDGGVNSDASGYTYSGYGIAGNITVVDKSTTETAKLIVKNIGSAKVDSNYNVSLLASSLSEAYKNRPSMWSNSVFGVVSDGEIVPAVWSDTEGKYVVAIKGTDLTDEEYEAAVAALGRQALYVAADADVSNSVFAYSSVNGAGGAVIVTGTGLLDTDYTNPTRATNATFTGNLFYDNWAKHGAAIDFDSATATSTAVKENKFIANWAIEHGGALDVHGVVTGVDDNVFFKNAAQFQGGALYVHSPDESVAGSGSLSGSGNLFDTNYSKKGGAVYVESGASVNLTDSTFQNNLTTEVLDYNQSTDANKTQNPENEGAGIYNNGGTIVLGQTSGGTGTTFQNNTAGLAGGAIYNNAGSMTISGKTTFSGNESWKDGGAIYNNATLNLSGNNITFTGNTAGNGFGHDIYNTSSGVVNITNVTDDLDKTDGHVTFDTADGLVNLGTFNFTDSKIQLHQGMNTHSGGTKQGTVVVDSSTIDLGDTNKLYANAVTIKDNSTVQTHVKNLGASTLENGAIEANTITVSGDNTLKVIVDSGVLSEGETKTITLLNANTLSGDFSSIADNKLYNISSNNNGTYNIYLKRDPATGGCDGNECATLQGWLTGDASKFEDGTLARDVYDKLNRLAQDSDCTDEEYRDALDAIAPDVSPLVRSHITEINRRLYSIISNRMYSSMERTGYIYRGKRYYRFPQQQSHFWVQAMAANSKYDVRKGFDGDDKGIAIGFDGHVNEALRMGIGYSYTQGDYTSIGRKTDIDSHTGMFYGEYNPNRTFVNWLATYTRSSFSEDKNVTGIHVNADYDVDAIGAQVMLGQKMGPYVSGNWSTGVFMPEVGLRYLYTKQGSYTDTAGQKVGESDGSSLTGILGLQYTIGYTLSPNISWYPELRAAITYDIMESDASTKVNLMNGNVYEVKEETMDRLGFELGGRVGLDINRKMEMSLEYEGVFRGDYTNHTGLANMKYKF